MQLKLRDGAPPRSVTDVGPGDYINVATGWERIAANTAFAVRPTPRSWSVRTESGALHGMWDINLYAKAEDMEPR